MTTNNDKKPTPLSVLIVGDEANIRKTLSYCLEAEGHNVIAVSNPVDAAEARRHSFELAFVDLKLGDENGMKLILVLLSDSPWIKIAVITAYASIKSAVEAMRHGATDYIAKPFTPDQVKLVTRRIGKIRELETEIFAMFLGRLEFTVFIVSLLKFVKDSRLMLKNGFVFRSNG